jgi:PHD/YefM family antitoxin component YafN of YafNO toxin-antitoxin module
MVNDSLFLTLDASALQADLIRLLERTARDKGRIEITTADGGQCIMISKEELDSLEKALEILSSTHDGQVMRQNIQHYAQLDAQPQRTLS